MNTSPVPLLITTAHRPPSGVPHLQLTDTAFRQLSAKAALYFWVMKGIRKLVLADATGCDLLTAAEVAALQALQVEVEQISYQQDAAMVVKRGKGYAEGKLLAFALENSSILAREPYFFKSTGKIYVRNFKRISDAVASDRFSNIFWRHVDEAGVSKPWADCRFYFTSRSFALQHLVPAYLAADDNVAACEYYLYEVLNRVAEPAHATRPLITGLAGGSGEDYFDESLGYLDANFPCWITPR